MKSGIKSENRQPIGLIKNYTRRLTDHELENINCRLEDKLSGDLPECLRLFQKMPDLDRWLLTADDYEEFYYMLDLIEEVMAEEAAKRRSASRN